MSGANHVEIFSSFLPSYTIIQQYFSSSLDCQEQGLALQAVSNSWDMSVDAGESQGLPAEPSALCHLLALVSTNTMPQPVPL